MCNPALLAKSIVAIDHISGGRFEPGFGTGWHQPEFVAHGYDFEEIVVDADRVMAGAPGDAVEQIAAFRDAGADMVSVALRLPVDQDALDAYLDVVVPAARAELA